MNLHHKISGSGPPVIILHGLFGMLDNWRTVAKTLEEHFQCILVDLRNHGRSPRADAMNYDVMSDDIARLMIELKIQEATILGHSMGGKVAMQFALDHPEKVKKLIVVDIAPGKYEPHHESVIKAINSLDPARIKERSEAETRLQEYLREDQATIQFLMKNLSRLPGGGFEWKANMPVILNHYDDLMEDVNGEPFQKPVLFIKGALSDSIREKDFVEILRLFPQVQMVTIENAGHWVHADQPRALIDAVLLFMNS